MGLIGSNRVEEDKVFAVAEPAWTDTWHPVSHGRLLENLEAGVEENNLRVTSREYSLNKTGTRLFGVWGLDDAVIDGMKLSMGFRNSIDKTLPIGICAGVTVVVCSNMALSGDMITFRKHTSGLDDEELRKIASQSVSVIVTKMEAYRGWIDNLRDIPVIEGSRNPFAIPYYPEVIDLEKRDFGIVHTSEFKAFTYDLVFEYEVFPVTSIPHFVKCVVDEAVESVNQSYPVNSWYTMFNAVTRMIKGENIFSVSRTTAKLENAVRIMTM